MVKLVLIDVNKIYWEFRRQCLIKLKSKYMSMVMAQIWRKRIRRWSNYNTDDYYLLWKNKIRRSLTVVTRTINPFIDKWARWVMYDFLKSYKHIYKIILGGRSFRNRVCFIQRKIKDQLVKKDAKTEILINYWDKLLAEI